MKFIGITGGAGAGKSKVLEYIRKKYPCEIYLADQVAHEVEKSGTECFRELTELLGKDVLGADGEIHKGRMAEKIFASRELLEKVNAIVHPAVKKYLLEKLEAAKRKGEVPLFFVEAALLIECGYGELVDEMWYVYAREEVRKSRLSKSRGYSEEKIDRIMQAQLTDELFRAGSDFVIDNSDGLENTYRQIDQRLGAFT